ncbi:right-handed parallel beta-helix repeat-containing protein [Treponema sp.]|uniref:right-handed parallel beta-helix repeat-containing protein n=1 Tax=Treponema sp. TaxID=166 RepID=UPI00257FD053|nr:right-handed parallel beta-helix repeat-containing protein [Treponema sp.]
MKKDRKIKNKIFSKLLTLTGILFVASLFLTGCADFAGSSVSKKETFTITVKTQNITSKTETKNRSAFPALSGSKYYTLSYKSGESTVWKSLDGTFPEYQMIIIPGTYTLKLDVYSDAVKTNHILTGNNSLTVTSGMENAEVSFILQPPENSTGNGSVNLVLSAETDTQITTFEIKSDLTLNWTKDDTETSYTKGTITADPVTAGTYHLTIYGKTTDGVTVYVRSETLTVWEGLESSIWIFADGTSSNEIKIKPDDLYSTFYVKGSSGTYNFYTADGIFGNVEASDTNSGSIDNPLQTVSAAVKKCVFSGMPYTIYVDGTVNESINASDTDPTAIFISGGKNITIKSVNPSGGTKPVIQGDGNGRIIFASGTVVLEDLVLKGGDNTNFGGGIYVSSSWSLTMKNCTITDCNATIFGGGLYIATNGSANLNGCTISKNTAQNGGGIYQTANATLTDCTFSGNTATINGKALYLQSGTLNVNGKIQSSTDDFYITTGKTITIQSPLSTDSSILVTPSNYTVGTQILQADSGANLADEVNKFKVSEDKWLISSDGKLFSLGTTSTSAEDNIAIFTNIPAGCEATVNLDNLSQTSWSGFSPAEISGNVTVTATNGKTISSGSDSIFTVKNGGTLTLNENVTLETSSQGTSCINVEEGGTLILNGATIQATSGFNVSGITITHGTLTINTGNITNFTGSPIVATNSIITITGGTISSNFSNVKLTDCTANIKNLIVTGNTTSGNGGGINISGGGTYMFNDCQITNNTASVRGGTPRYGGGIYIDTTGTVSFTNCNISGNTAKGYTTSNLGKGGGIYLNSGRLTTTGCTISSNTTTNGTAEVTGSGSQIYAVAGSVYNEETLKEDMIIDTYSE